MPEKASITFRIGLFSFALFWGAVTFANGIVSIIRNGPSKFFGKKKRTNRPICLDDPTLGTHSFIRLKNVRLHYVVSGPENKPLMLFLHGFPEFWYSWRHQIREFNKEYRCVAVDMRGYGESDKPQGIGNYTVDKLAEDVKDLIEALDYEKCTLVAHDWGGAVAQVFTHFYPNMVQRLVLCNIPHPTAFQKYVRSNIKQFLMSWYMFLFQLPCFPEFFLATLDYGFLAKTFKNVGNEDDTEAYKWSFSQPCARTASLNYYRAAFQYLPVELPRTPITVPTLLVWGVKDTALSKESAEMSKKYYKDFTLDYIEGAGHWVQMEAGDETNERMREFFQRKKEY